MVEETIPLGSTMPKEITNPNMDNAARRVRMESARRAREDAESGTISEAEFRETMSSLTSPLEVRKGGKAGKVKDTTKRATVTDRPEGRENKDHRSKLGLPDLTGEQDYRTTH